MQFIRNLDDEGALFSALDDDATLQFNHGILLLQLVDASN